MSADQKQDSNKNNSTNYQINIEEYSQQNINNNDNENDISNMKSHNNLNKNQNNTLNINNSIIPQDNSFLNSPSEQNIFQNYPQKSNQPQRSGSGIVNTNQSQFQSRNTSGTSRVRLKLSNKSKINEIYSKLGIDNNTIQSKSQQGKDSSSKQQEEDALSNNNVFHNQDEEINQDLGYSIQQFENVEIFNSNKELANNQSNNIQVQIKQTQNLNESQNYINDISIIKAQNEEDLKNNQKNNLSIIHSQVSQVTNDNVEVTKSNNFQQSSNNQDNKNTVISNQNSQKQNKNNGNYQEENADEQNQQILQVKNSNDDVIQNIVIQNNNKNNDQNTNEKNTQKINNTIIKNNKNDNDNKQNIYNDSTQQQDQMNTTIGKIIQEQNVKNEDNVNLKIIQQNTNKSQNKNNNNSKIKSKQKKGKKGNSQNSTEEEKQIEIDSNQNILNNPQFNTTSTQNRENTNSLENQVNNNNFPNYSDQNQNNSNLKEQQQQQQFNIINRPNVQSVYSDTQQFNSYVSNKSSKNNQSNLNVNQNFDNIKFSSKISNEGNYSQLPNNPPLFFQYNPNLNQNQLFQSNDPSQMHMMQFNNQANYSIRQSNFAIDDTVRIQDSERNSILKQSQQLFQQNNQINQLIQQHEIQQKIFQEQLKQNQQNQQELKQQLMQNKFLLNASENQVQSEDGASVYNDLSSLKSEIIQSSNAFQVQSKVLQEQTKTIFQLQQQIKIKTNGMNKSLIKSQYRSKNNSLQSQQQLQQQSQQQQKYINNQQNQNQQQQKIIQDKENSDNDSNLTEEQIHKKNLMIRAESFLQGEKDKNFKGYNNIEEDTFPDRTDTVSELMQNMNQLQYQKIYDQQNNKNNNQYNQNYGNFQVETNPNQMIESTNFSNNQENQSNSYQSKNLINSIGQSNQIQNSNGNFDNMKFSQENNPYSLKNSNIQIKSSVMLDQKKMEPIKEEDQSQLVTTTQYQNGKQSNNFLFSIPSNESQGKKQVQNQASNKSSQLQYSKDQNGQIILISDLNEDQQINEEQQIEQNLTYEQQQILNLKKQFVQKFNTSYFEGITFLQECSKKTPQNNQNSNIEQKKNNNQDIRLIKNNSSEEIAGFLLEIKGLNKNQLGKLFGDYKNPTFQFIFVQYCQQLGISQNTVDEALRKLLSKIKIPQKADQIDNILNTFTQQFQTLNQQPFSSNSVCLTITYSCLILNIDLHSDVILPNRQMRKSQFIQNNKIICNQIKNKQLDEMYDRIAKIRFEIKHEYLEFLYSKIHMQLSIKGISGQNIIEALNDSKQLINGFSCTKYGRKGQPHQRWIFLNQREDKIHWKDITQVNKNKKNNELQSILFSEIIDIQLGHKGTEVMRKNKIPSNLSRQCFSIISIDRTLDIYCQSESVRDLFIKYFQTRVLPNKSTTQDQQQERILYLKKIKFQCSYFWKREIMPSWNQYWDHNKCKPINFEEFINQNNNQNEPKKSTISKLFSSNKNKQKQGSFSNISSIIGKNAQDQNDPITYYELEQILQESKPEFVFIDIWKQGQPFWVRRIVWPVIIQNNMQITEAFYVTLKRQSKKFFQGSNNFKNDKQIMDSLQNMQSDVDQICEEFYLFSVKNNKPQKRQALQNILEAFIFYRTDISYIKKIGYVAAMLIHIFDEYMSFQCFINFIHSQNLLKLFMGNIEDTELIIDFFDHSFQKQLPELYKWFKKLALTSDIFIMEWLVTLFACYFNDKDIILRIWDIFLLEKELYFIQCSLGILKYFELELKMSTFDVAINMLNKQPQEVIDSMKFFKTVEQININPQHFQEFKQRFLEKQIETYIDKQHILIEEYD